MYCPLEEALQEVIEDAAREVRRIRLPRPQYQGDDQMAFGMIRQIWKREENWRYWYIKDMEMPDSFRRAYHGKAYKENPQLP